MRRSTTCFVALALVLAGCGDDDDTATDDVPVTTVSTTTTSAPTTTSTAVDTTEAGGTTTTTADEDAVQLTESCTSPDGFTISYPADWEAVSDCGQFGPAPLEEPAPNTDDRTGAVMAFVDPVPFERVSEPSEGDQAREETTVDGRPAVRIESVVREGLYPEGTEGVRWLVDLEGDRTLFVDAYDLGHVDDFEQAVEVLDAMARSVELDQQ